MTNDNTANKPMTTAELKAEYHRQIAEVARKSLREWAEPRGLLARADEYIVEAEGQDGIEYWSDLAVHHDSSPIEDFCWYVRIADPTNVREIAALVSREAGESVDASPVEMTDAEDAEDDIEARERAEQEA